MKSPSKPEGMPFEEALDQLRQIVAQLEQGNLPLEESIAMYERGARLAAICQQRLDEAELRVVQLSEKENGDLTTSAFPLPNSPA